MTIIPPRRIRRTIRRSIADGDEKTLIEIITSDNRYWPWIKQSFFGCGTRNWIKCWKSILNYSFGNGVYLHQYECNVEEYLLYSSITGIYNISCYARISGIDEKIVDSYIHENDITLLNMFMVDLDKYAELTSELAYNILGEIITKDVNYLPDCLLHTANEFLPLARWLPNVRRVETGLRIFEFMDERSRSYINNCCTGDWETSELISEYIRFTGQFPHVMMDNFYSFKLVTQLAILDAVHRSIGLQILSRYAYNKDLQLRCIRFGYLPSDISFDVAVSYGLNSPRAIHAIRQRFGQRSLPITQEMTEHINFLSKFGLPHTLIAEIYLYS